MRLRGVVCIGFVLSILVIAACKGGMVMEKGELPATLDSVPAARLEGLLDARLFFGHQSVGYNILEGVKDVLARSGRHALAISETRNQASIQGAGLYHATIGQNGDPLGKIRDFDAIMRGGMAGKVDAAFMKLCYVDIDANADVATIFAAYRDTLGRLKADFPRTTFLHFTVPIVARQQGIKPALKRLLGRPVRGFEDNAAREKLNTLIRAEYAKDNTLFDLALVESTRADGSRAAWEWGGSRYYSLQSDYTDDGGHLNAVGRSLVAERLLAFLATHLR